MGEVVHTSRIKIVREKGPTPPFPLSCMEIMTVPVALLFLYLFHPPTRSAGE